MKIRTFKRLESNVYRVSVYTEDWSEADRLLMEKFAEPELNLGGQFGDGSSVDVFTLDDDYVRIMSESPFTASFDGRDSTQAEERADAWAAAIAVDIAAAVTALRAGSDGFTAETIQEV